MTGTNTRPEPPVRITGILGGYIFGQLSLWLAPVFVGEFMHAYGISEQEIGLTFGLQAGAIGPVFSGFIAAHAGYTTVGWFTVGFCIVALSILLVVLQSLSRIKEY